MGRSRFVVRWGVGSGSHTARVVALAAAFVLLASVALDGAAPLGTSPSGGARVVTPKQQSGSAAGRAHQVPAARTAAKPAMGPRDKRSRPKRPKGAVPLAHDYAPRSSAGTAPKPPPPPAGARVRTVAEPAPPKVVGFDAATSEEVPAERDRYGYNYENADGSWTGKYFTRPVNYQDARGAWQPIDPSLIDGGQGRWTNRADSARVDFAGVATGQDTVVVDLGAGRRFGFGVAGARPAVGQVQGATVTYPELRPDADLLLESLNGGSVKEKIVLRSPDAPAQWAFPLRTDGVTPRPAADGSIELTDDVSGAVVGRIPHGFMTDSKIDPRSGDGARSEAVSYGLERQGTGWVLTMSADPAWLADPARKYPVTVDPTAVWNYGDTSDTYVETGYSSPPNGEVQLKAGTYDGGGHKAATYLGFSQIDNDLAHSKIYDVDLHLYNAWSYSCSSRAVTVHPVTQSWSSSSIASYPGPRYGSALSSRSFAHGWIPEGSSSSPCPAKWEGIDLGSAGNSLVQGWVNGSKPNYGLTVRASTTSSYAWKKFSSRETANGPYMTVVYSPYQATYAFTSSPPTWTTPVLNDQAGVIKVKVTNKGHETWTTTNGYKLQYEVYDKNGKQLYHRPAQTPMPQTVAYGQTVTVNAKVNPLPPGTWTIKFDMIKVTSSGYALFSEWGVTRTAIVAVTVPDVPPALKEMFPHNNYQVGTLTPQLFAEAINGDAWPSPNVTYWFSVCGGAFADWDWCESSPWQQTPKFTVPTGRLKWGQDYYWTVWVSDSGGAQTPGPWYRFTTAVAQPVITSHLAAPASADQEFDPQTGNYTTTATDAVVSTAGPPVSVVRTYNSLDPRTSGAFGAGWTTRYDMKAVPDDDGSGHVVVTYPDGQQVRFGKNPDGTFAPPLGRQAGFAAVAGGGWKLMDKASTSYIFDSGGRLTGITDNRGRAETLAYGTDGKLATVTGLGGRKLTFVWAGSHVATVSTDPVNGSPLTWTYTYSGDKLTKVCPPGTTTQCTTYGYGSGSHYGSAVADTDPAGYWRLGETSGTTAANGLGHLLGTANGTYTSATLGAAGALAGTPDKAVHFAGTGNVRLPDRSISRESAYVAVEAWFKTATGGHGVLIGHQSAAITGAPGSFVPALYVGMDGKLRGEFYNGSATPITSSGRVDDGVWHHAVLSGAGSSQRLYLDGAQVGSPLAGTIDHRNTPFTYVGNGYTSTNWPQTAGSSANFPFTGDIDEVAVYDKPLGAQTVKEHWAARLAAQQLTGVTLPSQRVHAANTYNAGTDRLTQQVDRHGGTWQLSAPAHSGTVDDVAKTVTVTDPRGGTLKYVYEPLAGNRLVSETDQTGATTSYGYDQSGGLIRITDRNGNETTWWRDARGNPIAKTRCRETGPDAGDCHSEFYGHYLNGADPFDPRNDQLTSAADGRTRDIGDNTFTTYYGYDAYGQQTSQVFPKTDEFPDDLRGVNYFYTDGTEAAVGGGTAPPGLLKTVLSPRGKATTYAYTAAGDLARVTDPAGKITNYGYDALGRRISQTEVSDSFPQGVTTTYGYDGQNRVTTQTAPAVRNEVTNVTHTAKTAYGYDADGNVLTRTVSDTTGGDADRVTTNTYDGHGRIETVADPEGGTQTFGYDVTGAVTSLIDARGAHYSYDYGPRGNLTARKLLGWTGNPDHPAPAQDVVLDSYAYDPAGRLASHTDAMGRTLAYTYYGDDLLATATAKNAKLNGSTTGVDVVVEAREYDGAGNLVASVTGDGAVRAEYNYDQAGQLVGQVLDPDGIGRRSDYQLDADNNVVKVTRIGADGDRTEFTNLVYDNADRVISRTVEGGDAELTTTYARDQRGLVTGVVDPRGNLPGADPAAYRTTMRYDAAGQPVEAHQPTVSVERNGAARSNARPVSRYGYNTAWEQTEAVDPEGRTVTASYDKAGRPVSVRHPSYTPPGGTAIVPATTLTYDLAGQLKERTDGRDHTTTFAYDALGDLVHIDDPRLSAENSPGRWSYDYDLNGERLAAVDPTGARAEATYDDLGRQITDTAVERYPDPGAAYTTELTYDAAGNVTAATTPADETTQYTVNAAGETTEVTDPLGKTSTVDYDLAGRIAKITDPRGNSTGLEYDLAGRRTALVDYDSTGAELRRRTFGYDAAGNPITETTPENQTTTTRAFDAANRMTSLLEPASATQNILTTFGYDAAGERTRLTDGRNNSTVTTYNSLGLPESVIEPATAAHPNAADRTWTRAYDAAGNPVRDVAPGGVSITRTFDELDRMTKRTGTGAEAATADQTYRYDLAGRRTRVSAPGGDIVTTYNDRGLPLTTSGGPTSQTAQFGYDADGRLASRTDSAGSATFSWDGDDRLTGTTDSLTGLQATFTYDAAGNPSNTRFGFGGARRDYTYDALDRQTGDTLVSGAGATLAATTYTYDKDDHLKTKTTTGTAGAGQHSYGYDDAGRLTSWTAPSGTATSYGWDAAGNRTQAGAATYTYDERNRLLAGGGTTYSYTARGTLASQTSGGTTKTLAFDAFDHLINDGAVSYAYDALDRVATRTQAGAVSKFAYATQDNDPVAITDAGGAVQSVYLRDPTGGLLALREGGWKAWAETNTHGDLTATFTTDGTALLGSTDFDPFGQVRARSGLATSLGYQGEYTDPASGRVDMHARWY
ncbi:MAG TPA: DNRLRE domain-containing protein, partial [Streptosporangiaceae bacterium]|nr:DNRLRE domain-containing protein [Streptosporangiaceae bacterium]